MKEKEKTEEPSLTEVLDAVRELAKEVGKLWKSHNDLIETLELKKKAGKF